MKARARLAISDESQDGAICTVTAAPFCCRSPRTASIGVGFFAYCSAMACRHGTHERDARSSRARLRRYLAITDGRIKSARRITLLTDRVFDGFCLLIHEQGAATSAGRAMVVPTAWCWTSVASPSSPAGIVWRSRSPATKLSTNSARGKIYHAFVCTARWISQDASRACRSRRGVLAGRYAA